MRSPLQKASGAPGFLRLRGKTYTCRPLKLRHFAEAKSFLVHMAPDPLKELAEEQTTFATFPPEIQKALALKALELREERRNVATADAAAWINGEEGALFLFWCMVRDDHSEFATLDAVLTAFPPGKDNGGLNDQGCLTIPEANQIRLKIDEVTGLGDEDKKKAAADLRNRKKILRRKMKT